MAGINSRSRGQVMSALGVIRGRRHKRRFTRLNLLLTISEHHRTSPPGHACGPSPHSSRWRLSDLSAWWSRRHVDRPVAPGNKSACRIHFDNCRRFRRRFADGACDYLGLLLNLRGTHYHSRCANRSRWPRAVKIHGLRLANAIAQLHSCPKSKL